MKTIETVVSMALMALSLLSALALLEPVRTAPQGGTTLAASACEGAELAMGCESMHL